MTLTATKVFQLLVEICAHLESEGFSASEGEDYDAKIGFLAAKWILKNPVDQNDVFMFSNIFFIYCGYDALRRFCDDVNKGTNFEVPYDFENLGPGEFIVHGHPGLNIMGSFEVYGSAARGRELGWKRSWCPFRHGAELLWYAGWDGEDQHKPELVKATKDIAQLMASL